MAAIYNQATIQSITNPSTIVDLASVADNVATISNSNAQFMEGLNAGIGILSIALSNISPGAGLVGATTQMNSTIATIISNGTRTGEISGQDLLSLAAAASSLAAALAAAGASLPLPQTQAIALGLNVLSLALNNTDEIAYLFSDEFSIEMSQAIQDFDQMLNQFWNSLGEGFNDLLDFGIDSYDQFLNWVAPPRDPLALDLDGDGIETLAANGYGGVLFDQNGDGVRRATGWVASDDGLLALDRNGNGTIDNGTELFGNTTPVSGGTASNGLAALADLDTNADGLVNASDAQFADLRVWRDLNSDGISQSNELFTLDDLGIASLNTSGTLDVNTDLGNGNSILNEGTFTWADGSQGTMADLALQEQTAYREFTDNVTISSTAEALPDVVATGPVRDLREAMSMNGGGNLTSLVTQFSEATTRAEQTALLDQLLITWAATSGFETSPGAHTIDTAIGGWPVGVDYTFAGIDQATQPEEYEAALNKVRALISGNIAASNDAVFCYNDDDIRVAAG